MSLEVERTFPAADITSLVSATNMDADAVIALAKDPMVLWTLIGLLLIGIIFYPSPAPAPVPASRVNTKVKMAEAKVVDFVDCGEIENLGQFKDGKLVMCR
ncbi:hypothetical protein B484DRAFT_423276 [Ochromonadaceae sp. CCMP2298]|nr:hypothetical protein B484DRAFT_423276 [Ochromonadaceae sp. CCMP2298]